MAKASRRLCKRRLHKAATKRAVAAKLQRKRFLASVLATKPTPESVQQAGQLAGKVHAAKHAKFLEQYRRRVATG